KLIEHAKPALEAAQRVESTFPIKNTDRAVGTMLSYEISRQWYGEGLPDASIKYRFRGSAGQSFGAFGACGLAFTLEGEANDYFGKGLSGARLIVVPDRDATFEPSENIIIGNVAFYGATDGESYIRGTAGERFAVRNSGVKVVVEGIGDHGCEYMTGGLIVVLGDIGKNFAAGMSGGMAYLYNPEQKVEQKLNREMVELEKLGKDDEQLLRQMLRNHFAYTSSDIALAMLNDWEQTCKNFSKVMPRDYKAVLERKNEKPAIAVKVAEVG
ncbi:MAG: glutamate synthase subunit alpha, partial [Bacteroidota bacterium]